MTNTGPLTAVELMTRLGAIYGFEIKGQGEHGGNDSKSAITVDDTERSRHTSVHPGSCRVRQSDQAPTTSPGPSTTKRVCKESLPTESTSEQRRGKIIPLADQKLIKEMRLAGKTIREIIEATGMGSNTVQKYARGIKPGNKMTGLHSNKGKSGEILRKWKDKGVK